MSLEDLRNGKSLKGHVFTEDDIPERYRHRWSDSQKKDWIDEKNARYRIVARCKRTGRQFIAEEVQQRAVNELSPKARRAVGMIMAVPDAAERLALAREVIAAFNADGTLKIPFAKV